MQKITIHRTRTRYYTRILELIRLRTVSVTAICAPVINTIMNIIIIIITDDQHELVDANIDHVIIIISITIRINHRHTIYSGAMCIII